MPFQERGMLTCMNMLAMPSERPTQTVPYRGRISGAYLSSCLGRQTDTHIHTHITQSHTHTTIMHTHMKACTHTTHSHLYRTRKAVSAGNTRQKLRLVGWFVNTLS